MLIATIGAVTAGTTLWAAGSTAINKYKGLRAIKKHEHNLATAVAVGQHAKNQVTSGETYKYELPDFVLQEFPGQGNLFFTGAELLRLDQLEAEQNWNEMVILMNAVFSQQGWRKVRYDMQTAA